MNITTCLKLSLIALSFGLGSVHASDFTLALIEAAPNKGFNYPYMLRIPNEPTRKNAVLLVETNNSGPLEDFEKHIEAAKASAGGRGLGPYVAGALNMPLLVPVFPRSSGLIYTHALDRDTIQIESGESARLDRQLLMMISDAKTRLKALNIGVPDKFVMTGFSASGTFANRFAFLHPDQLIAVAAGGINAFPMLPISEINGSPFKYPLGIEDLEDFTNSSFDIEAWKSIPQLIFMGALDDNDALRFPDAYSNDDRKIVFAEIGEPMDLRWRNSQKLYLDQDLDVTFITYGQTGHWTNARINQDVANFVSSAIKDWWAKRESQL